MNLTPENPESQARNAAFLQELQRLGWRVGAPLRNPSFDAPHFYCGSQ
jgi:hypothetical protein